MHLLVIGGPDQGTVFPLDSGETLQFGQGPFSPQALKDAQVSRIHCKVYVEGDWVVVIDGDKSSGTFVNGKRVTQQRLQPGDVIQIGGTQLRLQTPAAATPAAPVRPQARVHPTPPVPPSGPLVLLTGQVLSHYEVGPEVAEGESSVIFRARDTRDDRTVALKVLHLELSKDEEEMQRFVRAVKTVLPLRHPNIVALYEAGRTGPYYWVAMEFIEGENLTQALKRVGVGGTLHWRHALRVATHIARALEFAQEHHIIHRNIAPSSILIRKSDQVAKLGDLMLAKALEGKMAQNITRHGELLGDLCYVSPERTEESGQVDGRSDLYSLGAMVYALLIGRPPFAGGSLVEVMTRIRQAEPEKPRKKRPEIPEPFERVVLQMLAKRPDDRYQTPAELLVELEELARLRG